jgi:hypothetical protein
MKLLPSTSALNRRQALASTAAAAAGCLIPATSGAQTGDASRDTVLDRFWIFTCTANNDYPHLRKRSVMTPVEGAFYLGVPNIIVVQSSVDEAPYGRFDPPFAQYTIAMRPLKRVVWSVVGSGGFTSEAETEEVLALPKKTANFAGIMLDDFFFTREKNGQLAVWTVEQLADLRRRLKEIDEALDIYATVYTRLLGLPINDYLELIDVITLWTHDPADLAKLEQDLKRVEKLAPRKRIMQGCYVVDYGTKSSVPPSVMRGQCDKGLEWLREGRTVGMIFLGNTAMDLGFEAVEWTRQWIQKVGDSRL